MLTDMLLENSGRSEDQQLMIANAVKPKVDFESIAAEIRDQHPLCHERDVRRLDSYRAEKDQGGITISTTK